MRKRLLSVLLALCMVLTLLPRTVYAAEVASGTCGDNLTWVLDDEGVLTISGTGSMTHYSYEGSGPWYTKRTQIHTVIIDNGITNIGTNAFNGCSKLTSVTIPDSVTIIGGSAFYGCSSLTSVTIPNSVISIGNFAFRGCNGLTSAGPIGEGYDYEFGWTEHIPDKAFQSCTSLTSVTIPSSVTSIGAFAFDGCSSLTSATIPKCVTRIRESTFDGCTALTSVTIPDSVTSIEQSAFRGCSLTSVTIPDGVAWIGALAFTCSSLTDIEVANGNSTYCSVGGVLFSADKTVIVSYPRGKSGSYYCIPDSVICIKAGAFYGCSALASVTIPNSVTSIELWAFDGCSGLSSVTIPNSVTRIGQYAFYECSSLTSVTIPNSVTSIEGYAFGGCSRLAEIYYFGTKQQWNEINIDLGNGALLNATIHYESTGPNQDGLTWSYSDGILTIQGTGPMDDYELGAQPWNDYREEIRTIMISNGVTSIGSFAFEGCNSLTSVTIPSSVTDIGDAAFYGCSNLADVYYSGTEEQWNRINIGSENIWLRYATIHYNSGATGGNGEANGDSSSVNDKLPKSLTVVVSENKEKANSRTDKYQLSNKARINTGTDTAETGKDGAYKINAFPDFDSLTVSKDGFASVTRTRDQLKDHSEIYLERVEEGVPTVTAVWLNGVDIRHFEGSVGLLETNPVTITADVLWDSAKGAGTIKLIQGASSVTFSGNTLTTVLKNNFDVSETIYIWAGYDNDHATYKPLKLKEATATPDWLDGLSFDLGDSLSFTLPDSFPLLGGKKLKMGLYSSIPVTYSIEDGKVYVAIGYQEDTENKKNDKTAKSYVESVKDLKESLKDAGSAIKRYNEAKKAMKKLDKNLLRLKGSFGVDAGFSVMGFAEGYFDQNGNLHWLDSGLVFAVSPYSVSWSLPFYIGPVPLFFEASLSPEASAQLNLQIEDAAKSFTSYGVIEGTITASGGLGVGIKKVVTLSGGLEGELSDHWEIILDDTDYNRLTAKLKGYAKVSVLFFSGSKKWDIGSKTFEWPDRASMQSLAMEPYALYDSFYDPDQYTLMSEAKMTDNSVFLANGDISTFSLFSAEGGGIEPFVADVYSQSKPQLAAFSDGTLLAVWVGLDNSRDTYDRPRLYYSLCTNGIWNDPAPVDAAGTYMETEPALTIANDTAYLVWTGANGAMGTPTLEELAAKLDIFAATFDRTDGQWTVSALTQDQIVDFSPVIGGGSGGVTVVWQSNSANDLFGISGTNSISGCQYIDGVWMPFSAQYDDVGDIVDLSIDMTGNTPCIAWTRAETEETDEGISTVYDIYLDGMKYASGSGVLFDNGSLYWYQDGQLYQDGQDTGVALSSDRFQIENGVLLYLSSNGLYSTLMAHYYDSESEAWSNAVALTDGTESIDSFSAASVGTSQHILLSSTEVIKDLEDIQADEDDPYGSTNLVLMESTLYCDLSIGEPWYFEDTYTPGSTMTFYLDVTNNGTVPTDYIVSVSSVAGTTYSTTSQQKLLPGCTEEVAIAYAQGEVLDSQLTFSITPLEGGEDTNPSDNQTSLTLQYEDIAVEHIGNGVTEDGQYVIYADIVNRGYGVQFGIVVSLYQNEVSNSPLQTVTVDPLTSMASQPVSFQVPVPEDQICYILVVSSDGTDMNAANNSDFTVCTVAATATPIINVSVPATGEVIINPYRLPVETGEGISTEQIAGEPMEIFNAGDPVSVKVSAVVSVPKSSGVVIVASPPPANAATKQIFLYAEFKNNTSPWRNGYENADNQLVISKTAAAAKEVVTLDSMETGWFKLSGSVATMPSENWAATDAFTATITFTFTPILPDT